ncbi:hypothetical protein GGI08_000588 [Coemansia sp. S2]|nr:hypothetical protein GGI08_000588 [Coemansia sp. S2]KAJ2354331.1 hypothetical protein GGH92_000100 [Coemansia sp. RSA 2673]
MLSSTPFQFLPPHVVRLIVNHIVGSSRQAFAGFEPNSNEWSTLLKPLLWICHNFRAVVYPLYCSRYKLAIANSKKLPSIPEEESENTLDIEVDEIGIYLGEVLKMLSCAPYSSYSFSLVRRIVFLIFIDKKFPGNLDKVLVGKEVAERNILDFVQHIKLMAPNTKDIWVRPPSDTSICVSSSPIYNSLVSKIFQLANCIQYSETNMLLALVELKLELGGICNLVHIKFTAFHCDKNFRELVHQSSITLESLVVKSSRGIYIPSIVRGKDGDFVTYPCLHTLKLCGNPIDLEKPQPVPTNVVPFPSLRHLKTRYEYSIGDNVVFRGNAASLESVDLHLSSLTIPVFRQFLVFTPTSHPKLRYVRTWNSINIVPRVFATNLEALKFAMGIGPTAPVRSIGGYQNDADVILTLPQLDGLASIQVLALYNIALELWDVFALIKVLPMILDLSFWSISLGPLPDGVAMNELPAYVISTYAPMGRRVRCWHIDSPTPERFTGEVKCSLLLALACLNFTLVTVSHPMHKNFSEHLKTKISSAMLKPYAQRLRCFIYVYCL